jgi:hypothetical protein
MLSEVEKVPKIPTNYKRLNQIAWELDAYLKLIHGLYLDSLVGFSTIYAKLQSEQNFIRQWLKNSKFTNENFQDQMSFNYKDILKEDFCASHIHEATQGEVKKRNLPGGDNYKILAQMCIVYLSDYWNEYLRKEYAIAKGMLDPKLKKECKVREVLNSQIKEDFWADMTILRNSIVHHQGIATDKTSKCRLIKWFSKKEDINLTPEMMRRIFLMVVVFRNRLFREAFPKRKITIPTVNPLLGSM